MKQRDFDNILNECIDRVLKGESVEACLAAYPAQAGELEPLLRTAGDTIRASAVAPRPEFRQRAGHDFQAALRNLKPEKHGLFRWPVRWLAPVSIVIAVLLAGSGTVAASSGSLPDGPLYPVKLAAENVRLALTPSSLGKAELYTEFADRRVDEIIKMADKGKATQVVKATDRMNDQLIAMANLSLTSRNAESTGEQTPAALLAAPAADAATASEAIAPGPSLKAAATPAPEPPDNGKQQITSANLTSARAPGKMEARREQSLTTPTAGTLTPETPAKADKKQGRSDLKTTVNEQAAENTRQLEEVLKRAPDSVKPALERAIDVAGKGYDEALKNIERK